MGELRKDYLLDRYVIIANERAKRPDDFKGSTSEVNEKTCYFCQGNENMTPPEIERFPDKSRLWQMRVFPNKFPAVMPIGKPNVKTDNKHYTYSDAFGYHEIVVETPHHDETLADLSTERIADLFQLFKRRILKNLEQENIKYVSVFKNKGIKAGTSIKHTHCQLIASNIVPEIIRKKEALSNPNECPYCSILNNERYSDRRCFENQGFVSFTPYASRFPFEIWIFPKRHVLGLNELCHEEYLWLADIMKKILIKLASLDADYNFYLQYGIQNMHFHIEVIPRLTIFGGFEHASEIIINPMPPEVAAEFYRSF